MAGSRTKLQQGYRDLISYPDNPGFDRAAMVVLQNTTKELFNCLVTITVEPSVRAMKDYSINIKEDLHRTTYIIDDNTIFIVAGILNEGEVVAAIGVILRKPHLIQLENVVGAFAGSLTRQLTASYRVGFRNALQLMGDDLVKQTIAGHLASMHVEAGNIIYLIEFFHKLRTTSFEGRYFSTGLIITGSVEDYTEHVADRHGQSSSLLHPVNVLRKGGINRRFWYLADGKKSFYIADRDMQIVSLFNLDEGLKEFNYIDNLTLSHTIRGTDIMIKVENEKELSIVTPNRQEFIYTENKWSIRDYNYFILLLHKFLGMETELIESLLFFVLYCSKNGISAIIWIPDEMQKTKDYLKSRNRSFRKAVLINEKRHANLIIRLLSSDGVTIIDKQGHLQYYGCIVDLTKVKVRGAKGTGESAAKLLSRNGGAIKISRDGSITLHLPHYTPSILF